MIHVSRLCTLLGPKPCLQQSTAQIKAGIDQADRFFLMIMNIFAFFCVKQFSFVVYVRGTQLTSQVTNRITEAME